MSNPGQNASSEDLASLEKLKSAFQSIRSELGKVIIGQDDVIEQLLIAIFALTRTLYLHETLGENIDPVD